MPPGHSEYVTLSNRDFPFVTPRSTEAGHHAKSDWTLRAIVVLLDGTRDLRVRAHEEKRNTPYQHVKQGFFEEFSKGVISFAWQAKTKQMHSNLGGRLLWYQHLSL